MNKPYVVSADIALLLARWAERRGFILPDQRFFAEVRTRFSSAMMAMFAAFELVPEIELQAGLTDLMVVGGLPTVSLDTVYTTSAWRLEMCRSVDAVGRDCGLSHRPGALTIREQMESLRILSGQEVMLVDDVIFSGELMEGVIHDLETMGIRVPMVCAGVGIGEGIRRLTGRGVDVRCVRSYVDVVDEVCERDFYPGIPQSGRLLTGGQNIGVPYILPFGQPDKWASIPTSHQIKFSHFCIRQTRALFEEIERCSNRLVRCSDLGRQVIGMPNNARRFVETLSE